MLVGPAQMGWGYVDESASAEIAHRVLGRHYAAKDPLTAAYMAQYATARETMWK